MNKNYIKHEYDNYKTSWTRNEFFDENGYLIIKNICDPKILFDDIPKERGQLNYRGKSLDAYEHIATESQVKGSVSRYSHPKYREIHNQIRLILEKLIGRKLYNTYYYDRYYFPGQELEKHTDRDACEISISVHISTNLKEQWPFWIKTPDTFSDQNKSELISTGKDVPINIEAGDGIVYKGCERPHWRNPMPGLLESSLRSAKGESNFLLYYHQIFFHYVLQDGIRAHHAWDMLN